jgi:hypothetical protein
MSSAFEITARRCKALGWGIVLSCRTCRVVRDFNVASLLKHGRGDEDLERRFIEGKMRCSKCRTPSDWMRVAHITPGSLQESVVATWVRRRDDDTIRQPPE